jgi:hypothetical protein
MTEEELYTYAKVSFTLSERVFASRSRLTLVFVRARLPGHSSALPPFEGDCQAQEAARRHVSPGSQLLLFCSPPFADVFCIRVIAGSLPVESLRQPMPL